MVANPRPEILSTSPLIISTTSFTFFVSLLPPLLATMLDKAIATSSGLTASRCSFTNEMISVAPISRNIGQRTKEEDEDEDDGGRGWKEDAA